MQGLVVFINRSATRHKTFLKRQEEILETTGTISTPTVSPRPTDDEEQEDEDDDEDSAVLDLPLTSKQQRKERPVIPGKGISETRWIGRASTLHRFAKQHVLRAALDAAVQVIDDTSEAEVRATALGFKNTIRSPSFIVLLVAFKPLLGAVNVVSEYLQKKNLDIGSAMGQVASLKAEIAALRSDTHWKKVVQEAEALAASLGVDFQDEVEQADSSRRSRKKSQKYDDKPETQVQLSLLDSIRVDQYYPALDKITSELDERFPLDLGDFKFLQPFHFQNSSAEEGIVSLAERYDLDADKTLFQWRLFRHTEGIVQKDLLDICASVPDNYTELRMLYQVFLSLPVTTASVERAFSKLLLVKNRLRTTMTQDRLEALLLASVEHDLITSLDDNELVTRFASMGARRLDCMNAIKFRKHFCFAIKFRGRNSRYV